MCCLTISSYKPGLALTSQGYMEGQEYHWTAGALFGLGRVTAVAEGSGRAAGALLLGAAGGFVSIGSACQAGKAC